MLKLAQVRLPRWGINVDQKDSLDRRRRDSRYPAARSANRDRSAPRAVRRSVRHGSGHGGIDGLAGELGQHDPNAKLYELAANENEPRTRAGLWWRLLSCDCGQDRSTRG